MDKGEWVKGKESALWVSAVPGLRPGTCCTFAFASRIRVFSNVVAGMRETAGDRACSGRVLSG
jgi:hypothetical protein